MRGDTLTQSGELVDRMLENADLSLKLEVGKKYAVQNPLPASSHRIGYSHGALGKLQPGVPFTITKMESRADSSAVTYTLQLVHRPSEIVTVTAQTPNEFAQYLTKDAREGKKPGRPLNGRGDINPAFRVGDGLKEKVAVVLAYDTAKAEGEEQTTLQGIPAKAELIAQRTAKEKPTTTFEDLSIGMKLYARAHYFSQETRFRGDFLYSVFSLQPGHVVEVVDAEKKTVLSKDGGAAKTTLTLQATVMQEDALNRSRERANTYTFTVPLEEALRFFSPDTRNQDSTSATIQPRSAAAVVTAKRSLRNTDTPATTIKVIRDSVSVVKDAEVPPAPKPVQPFYSGRRSPR